MFSNIRYFNALVKIKIRNYLIIILNFGVWGKFMKNFCVSN